MLNNNSGLLIGVGTFLLILGAALPFLMVMHIVESTFFLNFLSYGSSVLGLLLGTVGLGLYQVKRKKKRDQDDNFYK